MILVTRFRDVSGLNEEILYALIGVSEVLTKEEMIDCFKKFGLKEGELENAFQLMLWYGVLGIAWEGEERYIYDYDYSMKRLEAEIQP